MAKVIRLFRKKSKKPQLKDLKPEHYEDRINSNLIKKSEKRTIAVICLLVTAGLGVVIILFFYVPVAKYINFDNKNIKNELTNTLFKEQIGVTDTEPKKIVMTDSKLNNYAKYHKKSYDIYSWTDNKGVIHYSN